MEPPYFHTSTSLSVRVASLFALYLILATWIKFIVARKSPGTSRILFALPAFVANTLGPGFFHPGSEPLQRISSAFILSWLCNFKVLAFCADRPPLRASMTVPQLAAVMILPVFTKPPTCKRTGPEGRLQDSAGSGLSLAGRWLAKIVLLGVVVLVLAMYGSTMHHVVRHYVYAFGLYAFVGFLMDGPGALAVEALGLKLVPTFDQPWMSSSLADFWGRRWNVTTSSVLRTMVYDTIVDGSFVRCERSPTPGTADASGSESSSNGSSKPSQDWCQPDSTNQRQSTSTTGQCRPGRNGQEAGEREPRSQNEADQEPGRRAQASTSCAWKPSKLRRLLALQATFFVSGAVHEYIAWFANIERPWYGKWFVFFWIQATLMTLEAYAGNMMRRAGMEVPRPVRILLTLALLEALAFDLFFGFVEVDTSLAARVLAAVTDGYRALLAPLLPRLAALLGAARLQL